MSIEIQEIINKIKNMERKANFLRIELKVTNDRMTEIIKDKKRPILLSLECELLHWLCDRECRYQQALNELNVNIEYEKENLRTIINKQKNI